MVNILISLKNYPPDFSGTGLRASKAAQRLGKKYGHRYRVLCISGEKGTKNTEQHVTRLHVLPETGISFPFHVTQVLWKTLCYLTANRKHIDIIHFYSFPWLNRIVMLWNVLFFRKKAIYENTLDDDDDPYSLLTKGKRNRLMRFISWPLLRRMDAFIVGSESARASCLRIGIDSRKVFIIPHFCDCTEFGSIPFTKKMELRAKLSLPKDAFILLSVGAVYPRKNQLFLVECLAGLKEQSVVLIIIGPLLKKNDRYVKEICSFIEKQGLGGQVLLLGEKQNINEYMAASDLFVFASKQEGFPNVIPEAIVSGLPVVATHLDCITLFINETTGMMINTHGELNEKIQKQFQDTIMRFCTKRDEIDRNALRSWGLSHLSSLQVDPQLQAVYATVSKGAQRRSKK